MRLLRFGRDLEEAVDMVPFLYLPQDFGGWYWDERGS
jgi:hypothetical protein